MDKGAILYKDEKAEEIKDSKGALINKICYKGQISELEYIDEEEKTLVSFKIKNDIIAFYLKDIFLSWLYMRHSVIRDC